MRRPIALIAGLLITLSVAIYFGYNAYHAATRNVVCDHYGQPYGPPNLPYVTAPPGWTETSPGSGCWVEP